jgi:hypothetical protein
VRVTNNAVTSNRASQGAGGIYAVSSGAAGSGTVTVSENDVTGNIGDMDIGGILAKSETVSGTAGSLSLINNVVAGNSTPGNYGGVQAISHSNTGISGDITLDGNNIAENTAVHYGGIYAYSYGSTGSGSLTIRSNTITANSGAYASGIYAASETDSGASGAVSLASNIINGNNTSTAADVRSNSQSGTSGTVSCVNNVIAANTSTTDTGGVNAASYTTSGTTGAITFTNNTVTGNSGAFTGGATIRSSANNAYVYNNIMRGNTGNDVTLYVSAAYGYNNNYTTLGGSWNGSGDNIDSDPLFVGGGNYRLASNSPCIDTGLNSAPGIPSTDFEGDDRIIDGNFDNIAVVDMGADEFRCTTDPIFNSDTGHYYATPQAAFAAASDGDTILALAATFTGPVTFAEDIGVSFKGGHNCGFEAVTGFTYFTNSLTIENGSMTVGKVLVK